MMLLMLRVALDGCTKWLLRIAEFGRQIPIQGWYVCLFSFHNLLRVVTFS
jgi:hypothetical protein